MHKRLGFTIVELLIAIVVISILAAVTVVAYNGIQDRAKSVQLLSSFDVAEKALQLYYLNEGEYPATVDIATGQSLVGDSPYTQSACLGKPSDYPKTTDFEAGECYAYEDLVLAINSDTINDKLAKYVQNISVNSSSNSIAVENSERLRGIMYTGYSYGGTSIAQLAYYQEGNGECGRGEKMYYPPDDSGVADILPKGTTTCILYMVDGKVKKIITPAP